MTPRPHQVAVVVRTFNQLFSATPRGARLARRLAAHELDAWGIPYDSPLSDTIALVVAELANNAVMHGRVPGRQFELRLTYNRAAALIRIEVVDHHPGRPVIRSRPGGCDAENGRGLLLVTALATRWGVCEQPDGGKIVFAEMGVPQRAFAEREPR